MGLSTPQSVGIKGQFIPATPQSFTVNSKPIPATPQSFTNNEPISSTSIRSVSGSLSNTIDISELLKDSQNTERGFFSNSKYNSHPFIDHAKSNHEVNKARRHRLCFKDHEVNKARRYQLYKQNAPKRQITKLVACAVTRKYNKFCKQSPSSLKAFISTIV